MTNVIETTKCTVVVAHEQAIMAIHTGPGIAATLQDIHQMCPRRCMGISRHMRMGLLHNLADHTTSSGKAGHQTHSHILVAKHLSEAVRHSAEAAAISLTCHGHLVKESGAGI